MEKKIESYLPLYLGQKVRYRHNWSKAEPIVQKLTTRKLLEIEGDNTIADVQLILRPLSSMTEEEERELGKIALPECDNPRSRFVLSMESTGKNSEGTSMMDNYTPEMVLWLLSKGFDIFRLKEKGLCLYPEEL